MDVARNLRDGAVTSGDDHDLGVAPRERRLIAVVLGAEILCRETGLVEEAKQLVAAWMP
nr:hypothetical protein [Methyloceanibacter superfactus]